MFLWIIFRFCLFSIHDLLFLFKKYDKEFNCKKKSDSITFNSLCKKYFIKNIHYLQIDTEGFDSEIIQSIDFNNINIDIIRYEKWNFSTDCFTNLCRR